MKIEFYKSDGDLHHDKLLTLENIAGINGMLSKCYLKSGKEVVGYGDPLRTHDNTFDNEVHDYIYLWTWKNIDEEKHCLIGNDETKYEQNFEKVIVDDIVGIEAIMYSNPRWGGKLTNKFNLTKTGKQSDYPKVQIPDFLLKEENE